LYSVIAFALAKYFDCRGMLAQIVWWRLAALYFNSLLFKLPFLRWVPAPHWNFVALFILVLMIIYYIILTNLVFGYILMLGIITTGVY